MNEHDAFMQAILADIDSDLPRLRYADFLDELGDEANTARAEFIRVQCALASLPEENLQVPELKHRERELLTLHWRDWLRPVCKTLNETPPLAPLPPEKPRRSWLQPWRKIEPPPPIPDVWEFDPRGPYRFRQRESHLASGLLMADLIARQAHWTDRFPDLPLDERPYCAAMDFARGFVARVELNLRPQKPMRFLDQLFATQPITDLSLQRFTPDDLNYLIQKRYLKQLRELWLRECGDVSCGYLLGTPDAKSLRSLSFTSTDRSVVDYLMNAPNLSGLKNMAFINCSLGNPDLIGLVRSRLMQQLEEFVLTQVEECDIGLREFLTPVPFYRLETLLLMLPIQSISLKQQLQEQFGSKLRIEQLGDDPEA